MALVNRVPQQCEDGGAGNESSCEALRRAEASLQTKWNERIFLFKFFFLIIFKCVSVWVCASVCSALSSQKRASDPPEQGIRSPWSWS